MKQSCQLFPPVGINKTHVEYNIGMRKSGHPTGLAVFTLHDGSNTWKNEITIASDHFFQHRRKYSLSSFVCITVWVRSIRLAEAT